MDPLLEVKTKPLGSGIPGSLRAYPEELEVRMVRSPREVDVQTVRYDASSRVEIEWGMTFAELKVKTRGKLLGGKTLRVTGLSEQDAERAKAFIEERMAHDSLSLREQGFSYSSPASLETRKARAPTDGICRDVGAVCEVYLLLLEKGGAT